jgi:DNA (cytosine-5)-methyltransferase 1
MATSRLPVISLFSGALGLDQGLEEAGFEVRVAVESDPYSVQTIQSNRPNLPVIPRPIETVSTEEILQAAGLKRGEVALVAGGPSCQTFSTAGQRGSTEDPRGKLAHEFFRVVEEARPQFFLMENVRGITSAAEKHRPLAQREPAFPELEEDEELGSAFVRLLEDIQQKTGYYSVFEILNTADFGVPQARERLILLGSRGGEPLAMPKRTHARNPELGQKPWVTLREALEGLEDPEPRYESIGPKKAQFLQHIPPGGNWRDLPEDLREEAMGKAYHSWGGRNGFLRRLAWDAPAPTLTSRPNSKATMMCHPSEDRTLSVREYGRLQQFPDGWILHGGIQSQYLQLGNAVPVGLGRALGKVLIEAKEGQPDPTRLGRVACPDADLIRRLADGPRTKMNPRRMRKVTDEKATRQWLSCNDRPPIRRRIRDLVEPVDKMELFCDLGKGAA